MRVAELVAGLVEVQAGDLGEEHALVQLRVGLTGEDLDGVSQGDELTAQPPDVDALSPDMGLAAVRQQSDPHASRPYPSRTDDEVTRR